jgi:hypothetical protein
MVRVIFFLGTEGIRNAVLDATTAIPKSSHRNCSWTAVAFFLDKNSISCGNVEEYEDSSGSDTDVEISSLCKKDTVVRPSC